MPGWNRGLGVVLAGILGAGGMLPGWAESGRVEQGTRQGLSVAQSQGSAAQQLIDEGTKLFQQGSKESLEQALVKFAEAIRVSQAADDKARLALVLLWSGRILNALDNKQQAIAFYDRSLPLYKALGDRSGEATTLSNMGLVYSDLGETEKALVLFNQSLPLSRAVGDRSGEATTLTGIGAVYNALGEKEKALTFHNQALPLSRAVGDRTGEAATLNNIGEVYDNLGETEKALTFHNQALPLSRAMGDRTGEATTLNYIGRVYHSLGENQKALEYYAQSLTLWRAVGNRFSEGTTLINIGVVYDELGEKQKALEYYAQSLPLSRTVGDRSGEATALFNIGSVYNGLGENQKALEYYAQSLSLSRAVGDRDGEATTLNYIGSVYFGLGEKQKALKYYAQSLNLSRALGDRTGEATTLITIGLVYADLGEKQKALEYYAQSLSLRRAVGDRSGEAMTLNNIGLVYDALGEKQKALEYYAQALLLWRAVGNRFGEAIIIHNIGLVYDALGEKQKALEHYAQSLTMRRAVGDRDGEAMTLTGIGAVYSDLGEKEKALTFYSQSLPLSRAVGDRSGEATTLNNIGLVYADLGEKQKAVEYYAQSLPLSRAVGDRSIEAITLTNIGLVYDDLGEKQKALEYYAQSLPLSRAVGDRSGEATTLNNIGSVYGTLGEKQKALEYYAQSLLLSRAVGDRSDEAATLANIGNVYDDLGEKQKALETYAQSLLLSRAVGNRSREARTFSNIASTYRTQNRLPEALTQINAAINLIEQLRSNIQDPNLKTSYFATVQSYYQFKIDLLMQLHQQDPSKRYDIQAFETSDQSRARTLRDLLTESRAKITRNISPTLQAKESDLQTQLIAREKQLIELSGKPKTDDIIQQLKTDIANLLRQQQDLASEIRRTNPDYAKLQYPAPISLTEIQQQLTPETLLLQYSLGKEASYLWAVTQTTLTTYKLPKQSDLETAAITFRSEVLFDSILSNEEIAPLAQPISQLLLGPVANQLGTKRLIIIPDGILHKIPFATLIQPTKSGVNNAGTNSGEFLRKATPTSLPYKPLLTTHEISYLPAASLIFPQHPDRPFAPKTIALLADPIFSPKDDRLLRKTTPTKQPELTETIARDRATRSLSLNRLPGTAIEAKAIASLVPESQRTIVTGFDSNYPWVTSPKLNQYRYLHLATHGIFDQERPELSSLILSLYDPNSEPQKGFLRLPDLFNLDLPTEMVTLSACQTGLGNSIPGEGLVGMTRGLIYAGAKRVTVSLWDVPDAETAELMQRFYRSLFDRTTPISHSAALRSAQLHLWNQGLHPYYWSAFILQGEWRN